MTCSSQVVFLSGYSGTGKSALIETFVQQQQQQSKSAHYQSAAQAATEASLIASSSQLANAFVAASQVLKVALDANKDLMTISKQRVDIAMADGSGRKLDGSNVTNNNLFVGTTADFIKMIKEKKSEDNGTE
jgi:septin family protein